jgi:hypothetical protein
VISAESAQRFPRQKLLLSPDKAAASAAAFLFKQTG